MGTAWFVQPKEIGLPFTAYYAVDEVREVRSNAQVTPCLFLCAQLAKCAHAPTCPCTCMHFVWGISQQQKSLCTREDCVCAVCVQEFNQKLITLHKRGLSEVHSPQLRPNLLLCCIHTSKREGMFVAHAVAQGGSIIWVWEGCRKKWPMPPSWGYHVQSSCIIHDAIRIVYLSGLLCGKRIKGKLELSVWEIEKVKWVLHACLACIRLNLPATPRLCLILLCRMALIRRRKCSSQCPLK